MNKAGKCYICDQPGTTREHVPPLSFFPSGHRNNLTTVPSCPAHNSNHSKDVEYIRNLIVANSGSNSLSRGYFKDKVLRSYIRSPKLKQQTFEKRMPVTVQGQNTVIVKVDLPRFRLVMQAVAYAIYFKDFGKSYDGEWLVYSPSLVMTKPIAENQLPEPIDHELRTAYGTLPFIEQSTPNPKVFKYAMYEGSMGVFYKFEFYEGFVVHVIERPPSQA